MSNKTVRIAVINKEKCKPTKCNFECGLICPVNRQRKECIKLVDIEDTITSTAKKRIAKINEDFCIGCGLCTKEQTGCPFGAVMIVNVPTELQQDIIHRFGPNGFRLYRMPVLKQGQVLGLLGQNGIGKSTIVSILSGKMIPNFEQFDKYGKEKQIQNTTTVINSFKGSEMHKYMTKLYSGQLEVSIKTQHVDQIVNFLKSKSLNPTAREFLSKRIKYESTDDWYKTVIETLNMDLFLDLKVITLSGGELQRLICAVTLLSKANVYIFDEATNFLDVSQRLNVSRLIRALVTPDTYVVVIEHDLSILDYISDDICIMYGKPSAYGVVSKPMGTANGINSYFDGYIASENMRFRKNEYNIISLNTSESEKVSKSEKSFNDISYECSIIEYERFQLEIYAGSVPTEGSITVVMGKNGTGKTSFINYVANKFKDNTVVAHKPQYLSVDQFMEKDGSYPTVGDFLNSTVRASLLNEMFKSDVVGPMEIDSIKDRHLNELSGGEMQRFWITYTLGQDAHVYFLDEPSSCLDVEIRTNVTKLIKKFTMHNKKIIFVVEHDMMMAAGLGSEPNTQAIIVTEKNDSSIELKKTTVSSAVPFSTGINEFLKILNVTFRTQSTSKHNRPRINKIGSAKDREQKAAGKYYD